MPYKELKQVVTEEKFKQFISHMDKLFGKLKDKNRTSFNISVDKQKMDVCEVTYEMDYEKRKARGVFKLFKRNGDWELIKFSIKKMD